MKKISSFDTLGGVVFSTNRELDLQPEQEKLETPLPSQQKLKVCTDKSGRKGKIVTLICNFLGSEKDIEELAKQLKKHCGVGGSAKDGEIIIQGDFKQKVSDFLRKSEYKVS